MAVSAARPQVSWFSSIIRAFPYLGAAYVIFLAAIESSPLVAVVIGIVLIVISAICAAGTKYPQIAEIQAFQYVQNGVTNWVGDFISVAVACGFLGLGLLFWSTWHADGDKFFSWLSIVALVAALALIVRASYLRKEA